MKKISCRANDSTSAVFPLDNPWKAVINIMDGPIRIRVDMKIRIPGTAAASSFGSALKMATACGAKISSITVARPSSPASANRLIKDLRIQAALSTQRKTFGYGGKCHSHYQIIDQLCYLAHPAFTHPDNGSTHGIQSFKTLLENRFVTPPPLSTGSRLWQPFLPR